MLTEIRIGIRELVKDTSILNKYDYIKIEDKKSHKLKGIFISNKYAKEVEEFLKNKEKKEIQEKLEALNSFAGSGTGLFSNLTIQKIKANIDV